MRHIEIKPTYITPMVILNPIDGKCLFRGNSILFDVDQFYIPIIEWVDNFIAQAHKPKIELTLEIESYNALSIERIATILQRLDSYKKSGGEVLVNWRYLKSDDDTLEVGEDFSQLLNIPFHYREYEGKFATV